MNDKIEAWIDRLDKYNICPYAAKSRRRIVEGDYNNLVEYIQNWDDSFEVIIFVFKDDISVKLAEEYEVVTNKIDKNVLVLLDHYKVRGFIENNSTCNDSELIVFLLQNKKKLMAARKYLHTTNYYDNWSAEYYKEVVTHSNDI